MQAICSTFQSGVKPPRRPASSLRPFTTPLGPQLHLNTPSQLSAPAHQSPIFRTILPLPFPTPGANTLRTITELPTLIFEKNVDVPLKDGGLCRANVYRPKVAGKYPGLMTYGPYGKDVPYADFHPLSFKQIPGEQKSELSAWEVPHPEYWVAQGYVVIRIDERGIGSSAGFLDTMSDQTSSDFAECIEWAAEQDWSNGKIGLLGISYYGGSQWRVAARRPKGLACILPWEGMTDYYRDRVRHGGILSNNFVHFWWSRQVVTMQYGTEKKAPRQWGPTIKGPPVGPEHLEDVIPEEELEATRKDQTIDNREHQYLDEPYHSSRVYDLGQIDVPALSVANLGGILLHLRGNVVGYEEAGTPNKWLYLISGRHDLPFYLSHYVALQKSFLDAWLKDEDDAGWKLGPNVKVPAVNLLIRKGNPGFNSNEAEATFKTRSETSWPIGRTRYVKCYLDPSNLSLTATPEAKESKLEIEALGKGTPLQFAVKFEEETEIAGHVVANLAMGVEKREDGTAPVDLDVFVTLRDFDVEDKEIFYTGTAGDPVPLCKGWLRASVRAIDETNPRHKEYLPHRNYDYKDVSFLEPATPYSLRIEVRPTAVVVSPGGKIVVEVATGDTQGGGIFLHHCPVDRSEEKFAGTNTIYFGPEHENWVQLPIV